MFRTYEKIHRLGKEETDGILEGVCYIQEKVDGANTQIWYANDTLHMGSRSKEITEGFNGFCDYVRSHVGINGFFLTHGTKYRLYGEWLVRHTIAYNELAYKKFYLFDVYDNETEQFLEIKEVYALAEKFGINIVPLRAVIENPTKEMLDEWVGKTDFGDRGEGIVIKNKDFKNKFGDRVNAKIVTESFKEDNGVVFGGNNKHSDTYWEVYVMNKYMTLERVRKITQKAEAKIDGRLDMKHIPMIMGMAYHDLIEEECWTISQDVPEINFKTLRRICDKKSKQIFVELLTGDVSVAHRSN
jgi:hypothetical protein